MSEANGARGLIAVDKMGGKVLFLNPATYATEVSYEYATLMIWFVPTYKGFQHEKKSRRNYSRFAGLNAVSKTLAEQADWTGFYCF